MLLQHFHALHPQDVWGRHRATLIVWGRIIGTGQGNFASPSNDGGGGRFEDWTVKIADRPIAVFAAIGLTDQITDRPSSACGRLKAESHA